jgi:hypothetical protein
VLQCGDPTLEPGAKCIVLQNRNFLVFSIISCQNERLPAKNEISMLFMEYIWLNCFRMGFISFRARADDNLIEELERGNIRLRTKDSLQDWLILSRGVK